MGTFDYRVHTDLNLIEALPSGVVEIADVVSYVQEVLTLDLLRSGTVEYVDLSKVTDLSGDYESARGLRENLKRWISRGWVGSVFFTPQEYQFGMVRMLGAVVENIQAEPRVVMLPRYEAIALDRVRHLIASERARGAGQERFAAERRGICAEQPPTRAPGLRSSRETPRGRA